MDDNELAIVLLQSDNISFEEKKEYIEEFLKKHPNEFKDEQRRLLEAWLELTRKNSKELIKNRIQKLNYGFRKITKSTMLGARDRRAILWFILNRVK